LRGKASPDRSAEPDIYFNGCCGLLFYHRSELGCKAIYSTNDESKPTRSTGDDRKGLAATDIASNANLPNSISSYHRGNNWT
jgi:hypothetical protein